MTRQQNAYVGCHEKQPLLPSAPFSEILDLLVFSDRCLTGNRCQTKHPDGLQPVQENRFQIVTIWLDKQQGMT
jgi:hypothetical protein